MYQLLFLYLLFVLIVNQEWFYRSFRRDDSPRERPDVLVVEICCHLVNRPRFRYQLLSRYQRTATVNRLRFVLLLSYVAVESFWFLL